MRLESPDLLVLCPPCGPFSLLQNWNYARLERAMAILGEGVQLLHFAMEMFEWQVRRGKVAVFEHLATSRAWEEECVQRVLAIPGVWRVRADQCEYGLRTGPNEESSKKPTDFMTNSEALRDALSQRWQGGHHHRPLVNGRVYPPELCQAMLEGLRNEWKTCHLAVWDLEPDRQSQAANFVGDDEVEAEEESEKEEEEAEDARSSPVPLGVSQTDKQKIRQLHQNLGHPSRADFVRALRMARCREEVWKWVQSEFRCEVCESHVQPKSRRPATIPRHYELNKTVGVDVVYFPGHEVGRSVPVLNIVDWGSCYQCLEPLRNTTSQHVWRKFMQSWGRVFGMPEVVVVDQGREFLKDFAAKMNESGTVIQTIGARAPHQQGRTERHGGLAKSIFLRMRDAVVPDGAEEWRSMIYEVEMAKNRLYGYFPAQRQIGANIRLPGTLQGDDPYDGGLLRGTQSGEVHRLWRCERRRWRHS